MTQISTVGARILNALHDGLADPEPATAIVRPVIRRVGADDPSLADCVLDALHMQLPYPTQACAIVRLALISSGQRPLRTEVPHVHCNAISGVPKAAASK